MSMRITSSMMNAKVLTDLRASQSALARSEREVSSGKKLHKPSDDALATRDVLRHRSDLEGIRQFKENGADAAARLDAVDSSLQSISGLTQKARELAIQGGNDATGTNGRLAIAAQIDKLIGAVKDAANAKVGDSYVMAGTASTTRPYTDGPSDAFAGTTASVVRQLGPGVSVDTGVPGSTVVGSGGTDGQLLSTLRSIKAHLESGTAADLNALRGGDLTALDANLSTVTSALAEVGARRNRVDAADARLTDAQTIAEGLRSNAEDADLAESLMSLSAQQAGLQAALKAGAGILQPSLMDFLN